ncbi:hypothetical protein RRG08_045687 [Elysia crispata]|uniref:Uncharacterized protein n=1 Tax=Elysia crispata TaxID=231223 RepID=A0AAE1D994_9GAST|nr:hypothetical protein RRG08_045687 [Elysia crispata]
MLEGDERIPAILTSYLRGTTRQRQQTPQPIRPSERQQTPQPIRPSERQQTPQPIRPSEPQQTPQPIRPSERQQTPQPIRAPYAEDYDEAFRDYLLNSGDHRRWRSQWLHTKQLSR